jgi:serine/threonine protein kinase
MNHGGAVPKNILVTGSPGAERIKVLPLGLRKLYDAWHILNVDVESNPFPVGDYVGYWAPEQVRGEKCDARADLYTLGTVMYEMLTGSGPFGGASLSKCLYAILHDPPIPFAVARPGLALPKGLEDLVTRCLEKDPHLRPANARELIRALQQV